MGLEGAAAALVDEAMKKSALLWVRPPGGRWQVVWHVWHGEAVYLLFGPGEQPNPGLVLGLADVAVRSKDDGHLLVTLEVAVEELAVADVPDVAAELAKTRLNLVDAESAPQRWSEPDSGYAIVRLTPVAVRASHGSFFNDAGRAAPVPSPATTRGRLPVVFHRRGHHGRRLS